MIPPRVVLDTGVFIAQLGSGLRGGSVWRFIETGRIIPLGPVDIKIQAMTVWRFPLQSTASKDEIDYRVMIYRSSRAGMQAQELARQA